MKLKIKQIFKMAMQHIVLPFIYFINKFHKIKPGRIIFADAHHEKCPPHMELLRERFIAENYEVIDCFFDIAGTKTLKSFRDMCAFMRLYTTAQAVIICDYYLPANACRKKKGTMLIQLWHACGAFKKFGYDAEDDIPRYYKGNVHKNYDLVTVSGNKCIGYFESAMHLAKDKKIVKALGISTTDKLYSFEYKNRCLEKFKLNYPESCGKKVILWAPTFRGNAANAEIYGEAAIDMLSNSSDYYVIKSLHPHMKNKIKRAAMTTEELMLAADVLITDYSSVFFDYLIFDRPIVFFAPDYNEYYKNRGFYLSYDSLPGIKIKEADSNKLLAAVKESIAKDEYSIKRNEVRARYLDGCDGNATERILDYVKGYKIV